jgi:hypothetical protein
MSARQIGLAAGRPLRVLWLPAEHDEGPTAEWSADAEHQLQHLPPIVRGVVRGCAERYVRAQVVDLITPSIVCAARRAAQF